MKTIIIWVLRCITGRWSRPGYIAILELRCGIRVLADLASDRSKFDAIYAEGFGSELHEMIRREIWKQEARRSKTEKQSSFSDSLREVRKDLQVITGKPFYASSDTRYPNHELVRTREGELVWQARYPYGVKTSGLGQASIIRED